MPKKWVSIIKIEKSDTGREIMLNWDFFKGLLVGSFTQRAEAELLSKFKEMFRFIHEKGLMDEFEEWAEQNKTEKH